MRQQLTQTTYAQAHKPKARRAASQAEVIFEYTGQTGLTVNGSVSGRRYRFDYPGARVEVDPRDRPGLAKVPNLRRVS